MAGWAIATGLDPVVGPATHEFVMFSGKVMGGRAKRGHDTWVDLSAAWYNILDVMASLAS